MKSERALRYNEGKPKWSLVDFDSLEPMVRVLEYGMEKYSVKNEDGDIIETGRDNWKKGMPLSEVMESLFRHTIAIMKGEFIDKESGKPHIGHIMCNAMFASYILKNKPEFIDIKSKTNESKTN